MVLASCSTSDLKQQGAELKSAMTALGRNSFSSQLSNMDMPWFRTQRRAGQMILSQRGAMKIMIEYRGTNSESLRSTELTRSWTKRQIKLHFRGHGKLAVKVTDKWQAGVS
ncbi:hypothetical protein TNCV_3270771 [Trichonephila clavipes]|nr:hypothetical protein TNCV_3270771 [Trichonephila clavipes]